VPPYPVVDEHARPPLDLAQHLGSAGRLAAPRTISRVLAEKRKVVLTEDLR